MSSMNIKTLRDSFDLARPHALKIVNRFYELLWTDYPVAKTLFAETDMTKQQNALVGSLAFIVDHLDNTATLVKYLEGMGERHIRYGVEEPHYEMVGNTLLKTFAEAFGEAWSLELAEQWALAVGFIATTMKDGAARAQTSKSQVTPTSPAVAQLERTTKVSSQDSTPKTRKMENVKIDLPDDLRNEIRKLVREALQDAIQSEIQQCIQEELVNLNDAKVTDLFRKRA